MDIHNIYTDVHNCIFLVIIQILEIRNDIFTHHNVFLNIQNYIVFHFGLLKYNFY